MTIIRTLLHFLLKMNKFWIIFLMVHISIWAKPFVIIDQNRIYDLNVEGWKFTEKNPFHSKNIQWKKISISTNAKKWTDKNEIWYRIIIHYRLPLKKNQGVKLGIISDRDRTYWNGILIGKIGKWNDPHPQGYDRVRIYEIPPYLIKEKNELIVHVKGYFPQEIGLIRETAEIGSLKKIYKNYYDFYGSKLLILLIYLTVGSFFLFLFLRRGKERENMYYGIFMYLLVIYLFLRNPLKYEIYNELFPIKRLEYIVLFLLVPFFYFFIYYFYEELFNKKNKLFKLHKIIAFTFSYINIASIIVVLIFDDVQYWDQYNRTIVQYILWPPIFISMFGILFVQSYKKNWDAISMLFGFLIVLGGVIVDILIIRNIINMSSITTFTFFAFIISLTIVLANRYVRLNIEIEELNKNLEKKVEERTKELQISLKKIQSLKERQDADYFLTSLLLKPLNQNLAISEVFEIETYLKQYKQFQFKDRLGEIGGDIIITDSILLDQKPHIVFLNGDAMGKSMQGAGGSIVLGTVFMAIIKRTKQLLSYQKMKPKKWLKECYRELQNVFVTFDGSMLASAVIGVIDEASRMLYFINIEHPGVVVYRNQKAFFIQRETDLRKLGISLDSGVLKIYSFSLQPEDMIFIGSDGKDDIELRDVEGKTYINEDEYLFLSIIEKTRGDIKKILETFHQTGRIMDDLSIIKIYYKPH